MRQLGERGAAVGHEGLVGGHDRDTVAKRGLDIRTSGLDSARELDEDVEVLAGAERRRVIGHQLWGHAVARLGDIPDGNPHDLERRGRGVDQCDVSLAVSQQSNEGTPYESGPDDADANDP